MRHPPLNTLQLSPMTMLSTSCSAAVLGYLTSLLLRTLPAMYNDPYPQAGTPMSAAQLAERDKPKSPAAPIPQVTATTPPQPQHIATQPPAPALAKKPVLATPAMPPTTIPQSPMISIISRMALAPCQPQAP